MKFFGNAATMPTQTNADRIRSMTDEELDAMRSLVSGFFDFAEMQAKLHRYMYMSDYMALLEDLIRVNKRPVLAGKGKVLAEQAKELRREAGSIRRMLISSIRTCQNNIEAKAYKV